MKFLHSLFIKLLFGLLFISIVPLSIVGIIIYQNTSQSMMDNLNLHANYTLDQKADRLYKLYNDLERLNRSIVNNPLYAEFAENKESLQNKQLFIELDGLLQSIQNIFPELEGLTMINQNNDIYYYGYSLSRQTTAQDFYEANWYIQPTNLHNPVITPSHKRKYVNAQKEKTLFSIIYKAWDYRFKNYSNIIIDVPLSVILSILNVDPKDDSISGSIILDSSKILFSSDDKLTFPYNNLTKANSGSIIETPNNEKLIIYKRQIPHTQLIIVEYFEFDKFYQPVFNIRKFILYTILITIIISVFASLFITNRISQPIYKLQKKMKEVEMGNFEKRFITNSKDVIGDLANGFNHMLYQIKNLIHAVSTEEKLKREAEITALQLQINPHFLYNTLETINSLARKKKECEISNLIVLLGRLLRLSISSFDEMVPVETEAQYIEYYLKIQQKRMRHSLEYDIVIDKEIKQINIIKWILQPIVENAIIHGIESLRETGKIYIEGRKINDLIVFTIVDNGIGMDDKTLLKIQERLKYEASELTKYKNKIGLFNVQSRIDLHYGKPYGITISSKEDKGTQVHITIPYRSEENA